MMKSFTLDVQSRPASSPDSIGAVPSLPALDPDPASKHQGETREQRIREFHEMNDAPVVGLREAAMLEVGEKTVRLRGTAAARVFSKGQDAVEDQPGATLDFLLSDGRR